MSEETGHGLISKQSFSGEANHNNRQHSVACRGGRFLHGLERTLLYYVCVCVFVCVCMGVFGVISSLIM